MKDITQAAILGIDVSRDYLDGYFLPGGQRFRKPNTEDGHAQLIELLAVCPEVMACFEATGGQEWRLWATLDAAGIETRQLPPAQIKAFAASRGTRAKTDRIDAELIARFLAFRPDAGRKLPHEKLRLLRALCAKRGQLMRFAFDMHHFDHRIDHRTRLLCKLCLGGQSDAMIQIERETL